jgi:hypothetical protein
MNKLIMRSILSISIPKEKKMEIEARAKRANISTSAYIVRIVELEKSLISEDEIIKASKKAENDYKKGKTRKLKSLKNLMKD